MTADPARPDELSAGARPPRLLGVFAHPDDETFCAGGTFARYASEGAAVMVVSATRGQAGQIRDASVGTRRTIGAVRERELRLACERLGVSEVRCWDHMDGALAEADFEALVGQVVEVVREFRPDVVVSFGPDGGYGHPDHVTISRATTAACREAGNPASYADQLAGGLAVHEPQRLYHSCFPSHDVLLLERLATWLASRPEHFAGNLEFAYSLLLMAEEAETLGFVRDHASVCWYPPGGFVVEQGEAATDLFLILSGRAEVWQEQPDGSRQWRATLGPGEFFGELGVAHNRPRNADVVALEGLTCLVFAPAPPTAFAGRGEGARLVGGDRWPGVGPQPGPSGGRADGSSLPPATAQLDVSDFVQAKVQALCAYRSQFPLDPRMYPDSLLRELFGQEYFVQVLPPPAVQTGLL